MNLDELDRLHAAATAGERLDHGDDSVRWDDPMACGYDSREPEVYARLRAAEAEVERLRALCRDAAEHIDPMRWGHGTAGERALVARLDRAALGEP